MDKKRLNALSLFSGAGVGETYLKRIGIDVKVANELLEKRAGLYRALYPETTMICGDVTDEAVFNRIMSALPEKVDFVLASPPCQGMSVAGKNRKREEMESDRRNYLVTYAVKAIKLTNPDYAVIENVPALLGLKLPYGSKERSAPEILELELGKDYDIDARIFDAADFGVPQTRRRAIIRIRKKGLYWAEPEKTEKVTVEEAIGGLPSLEAGEKSDIKWHYARKHSKENVLWMKHTPTGESAFSNSVYYPKKKDGTKISGYGSCYRRIRWDAPAPTVTVRNDCIASQRNVHPGRLLPDGTYSDARVLTPLELFLLTSLPADWPAPDDAPELLIRQCIGEAIPPLMLEAIVKGIFKKEKLKAISLFSGAGIGELSLKNTGVEVVAANELLKNRADCYKRFFPETDMYCGDATLAETREYMIAAAKKRGAKVLIATPPCQGLSTLGKNKKQEHFKKDARNYLIFSVLDIIDACDFDYILIENVPRFLEMYFPFEGGRFPLEEILNRKYSEKYAVEARVLNARNYGICQSRPRALIKLFKRGLKWAWPKPEPEIPLIEAIGSLPSLEAGESSDIPWHFARKLNPRTVLALRHTPTGKSAIANEEYYPKKADGTRIKGFHNTFKRMNWDEPCPTRTTYSGSASSHNNVHPGRPLPDGTYSDARVLTLLETFIVSSVPEDVNFPENATESFIRTAIGESIPPKLMMKTIETIGK